MRGDLIDDESYAAAFDKKSSRQRRMLCLSVLETPKVITETQRPCADGSKKTFRA
jgi:hypothetical protein